MSPIQRPTPRAPAQPLGQCLGQLERQWQSEGSLAALWQAWPEIAGAQLAPHCRPLALRGNTLLVGASQPQWLQALRYSRHQLLAVLRSRGYAVNQLHFQQHDVSKASEPFSAELARSWSEHPCRITGSSTDCPRCGAPSPSGEIERWGCCALCLHQQSS